MMETRWSELEGKSKNAGYNGVASMSVFVRVKPSSSTEDKSALYLFPEQPQMIGTRDEQFVFDGVLGPETNQSSVYSRVMCPLLDGLKSGYNCTLVAYGSSGTGKTYTMGMGPQMAVSSEIGIIPRVITDLLSDTAQLKLQQTEISVSFIEIYGNKGYDLLTSAVIHFKTIDSCTETRVHSTEEALSLLARGVAARRVRSTALNVESSRSHAVFTVHYKSRDLSGGYCRSSRLRLVDLGGVEGARRTGAGGDTFREGVDINQGLLALEQLLRGLRSSIPTPHKYRGNALTYLLKDALNRQSVMSLLVCVSGALSERDASVRSLRLARVACTITLQPEHARAFAEYKERVDCRGATSSPPPAPPEASTTTPSTCTTQEPPISSWHAHTSCEGDTETRETGAVRHVSHVPTNINHSTPISNVTDRCSNWPWSVLREELKSVVREEIGSAVRRGLARDYPFTSSPIHSHNNNNAKCRLDFNENGLEKAETMFKVPQLPVAKKSTQRNKKSTALNQTKAAKVKAIDKENEPNTRRYSTRRQSSKQDEPNDSLDVSESENIKTVRRSMRISNILANVDVSINTIDVSQDGVPKLRRSMRLSTANATGGMDSFSDVKYTKRTPNTCTFDKTQKKMKTIRRKHEEELVDMTPKSKRAATQRIEKSLMQLHRESVMAILNDGSEKQLMSLATVGPKTASQIYTHRMLHGKFRSEEDLKMAPFWRGGKAFDRFMAANNMIAGDALAI